MTLVQIAASAGALILGGLFLIVYRYLPATPDLTAAVTRLHPDQAIHARTPTTATTTPTNTITRLGTWSIRTLPALTKTPTQDLELLGRSESRWRGEKLIYAAVGLLMPSVLMLILYAMGITPPLAIPAIVSIVIAVALSFLPDYNVRSDAAEARTEFRRALVAYIDLVAMQRRGGAGPRQAMEAAAKIGDTWPFHLIDAALLGSRYSGQTPWDALESMANRLGLPALSDLADTMRLSGEEGSAVVEALSARAASLRSALTTHDLAHANATAERLTVPGTALAFLFSLILIVPVFMRILAT